MRRPMTPVRRGYGRNKTTIRATTDRMVPAALIFTILPVTGLLFRPDGISATGSEEVNTDQSTLFIQDPDGNKEGTNLEDYEIAIACICDGSNRGADCSWPKPNDDRRSLRATWEPSQSGQQIHVGCQNRAFNRLSINNKLLQRSLGDSPGLLPAT